MQSFSGASPEWADLSAVNRKNVGRIDNFPYKIALITICKSFCQEGMVTFNFVDNGMAVFRGVDAIARLRSPTCKLSKAASLTMVSAS
jgi:hypothetical protein